MTAPATKLTITQSERLRSLAWEKSQAVTPGRIMLCKGRSVVGFCNVEDLARTQMIEARANTVCVAADDYDDVMAWVRGWKR